jgi:2-oxoglutarate/2-oxoacid ferredoxin oxidoreductase subunit alpha
VGWGALSANCDAFFGYPITPQSQILEWFAREYPNRGRVFVQSQCETGAINMVYGAAAAGARAMTATASPGWALMQETMSHLVNAELPCVVCLVQRGGPGQGTVQHSQMDYLTATRGGGQGGYKVIVLAPASIQEIHDLTQLAFHLADKYRNPVVVLNDGVLALMSEPLRVGRLQFGECVPKDWAVTGKGSRSDRRRNTIVCANGIMGRIDYLDFIEHLDGKFGQMAAAEVRFESYHTEDAEVVLVAFGYVARVCLDAVDEARGAGIKAGLLRPISLWPFPAGPLQQRAAAGARFLVVEDNLGQMVEDVRLAVGGRSEVYLLNMLARHRRTPEGMILPERVVAELEKLTRE